MRDVDARPEPDLLAAARRGDEEAFERLVGSYRGELYAHCYRMLGSVHDAEDALQESLLGAWRGIAGFEGRSSLRAWLYRINTNACLRLTARRPRRILSPDHGPPRQDVDDLGEPVAGPVWLEPRPDEEPASEPGDTDPAAPRRLVPIRANGQLAFACYQGGPGGGPFRLGAINVLGLRGGRIVEIAGFLDPGLRRRFGLPAELPGSADPGARR